MKIRINLPHTLIYSRTSAFININIYITINWYYVSCEKTRHIQCNQLLLLFNIVFPKLPNAINPQIKTNTGNTGKDGINLLLFIDMIVFLEK